MKSKCLLSRVGGRLLRGKSTRGRSHLSRLHHFNTEQFLNNFSNFYGWFIKKRKAISAVCILTFDTFSFMDANFHKLHNSHKQLSTHTNTCIWPQNVICHVTWAQTCELETRFNCSVDCRLSTAVFRTLMKTNYLEETFIPGSTFASKMKVLKPNRTALKLSISHCAADVTDDKTTNYL